MYPWWYVLLTLYAGFTTISIMSYLFKPNITFDIVEGIMIGGSAAATIIVAWPRMQGYITGALSGNITILIGLILGLLMFSVLVSEYRWVAHYPSAILLATGFGALVSKGIEAQILGLTRSTAESILNAVTSIDLFNGILVAVGTFTSVWYFVYRFEMKGTPGNISKIGRNFMMISMGMTWASYMSDKTESTIMLFNRLVIEVWKLFG